MKTSQKKITDPEAKIPDGWREDLENGKVSDETSKQPDDWDVEEDGDWEAPMIDNPACAVGCGKWEPPQILNPENPANQIADATMKIEDVIKDLKEDADPPSDAPQGDDDIEEEEEEEEL